MRGGKKSGFQSMKFSLGNIKRLRGNIEIIRRKRYQDGRKVDVTHKEGRF